MIAEGEKDLKKIQNVGEKNIATNRVPIKVDGGIKGAVATFQDVTRIQELEQNIRRELNKKGLTAQYHLKDIVGKSDIIKQKKKLARKYGKTDSTVLIYGESGTGKELFAHGIHNCSQRKNSPFVAINCAALPTNLLESELFGYEEGTFTGAKQGGKKGLFELAHQGTILLDEIGEMDKKLQARLLRVSQERRIMRLGGREVIPIDVRILSATNKDLGEEVRKGNFRKDLYYRLNVLELEIPPLRERRGDIEVLTCYLLKEKSQKQNKEIELADDIINFFREYEWPGNVRELENIIEKIVVIADSNYIERPEIDFILEKLESSKVETEATDQSFKFSGTLEEMEKMVIARVIEEEKNKKSAAKKLGIDRSTLYRKIKKYDLE